MFEIDKVDKYFNERHGNFTASEIGKLLGNSKSGEMFGATALGYIRDKAIESMTNLWERPELDEVASLLHGKAHEEPAYEMYKKVTGNYSMRYFGSYDPIYLSYNEHSGGSPDGLMGEGEKISLLLEVKCPRNPNVHFDYLGFKSQWDLKEKNIDYYAQVQFLLMITKSPMAHWVSYDDRWKDYKLKLKVVEVFPDEKFQNNLEVRIMQAIKKKQEIINQYSSLTV